MVDRDNPTEIEVRHDSVAGHLVEGRPSLGDWVRERITNMPWWLVSVAFHVVVLLVFAVIMMYHPSESGSTVITVIGPLVKEQPKIDMRSPVDDLVQQFLTPEEHIAGELLPWEVEEESEHIQTDTNDDGHDARGESLEFLSNKDLKSVNDSDSIGLGRGPAGRYGKLGNEGSRLNRFRQGGPSGTQGRVVSALIWLARHQNPNGSWGARTFWNQCQDVQCQGAGDPFFDVGLTGLALLAFTGATYTPGSRDPAYQNETGQVVTFGQVVRQAALYVRDVQSPDGAFGAPEKGKFMYNQAIATYALADLVALMKEKQEPGASIFRDSARQAVNFLLQSQNPGQAWRYTPGCGDNDVSVTGWCAMALKAAEDADLIKTDDQVWNGIKNHLDEVTDPAYGVTGYTTKGAISVLGHEQAAFNKGQIYVPPSLTAVGIMMRIFMNEKRKNPVIKNGALLLTTNRPVWDTDLRGKIDYYYWFYGSYALNQYDGPKGVAWTTWNKAMKNVLSEHQRAEGCATGSWDPLDRWSEEGSRVYSTAINALTLEVYYRLRIIMGQ